MAAPGQPERQKSDRQSLGEESPNSAGQGASEEEDPATGGDGKCNRK